MRIYYSDTVIDFGGSIVALGNFDGLHTAHTEIIRSCVKEAGERRSVSGVLLFDHHSADTTGTRNVSLLMSNKNKLEILEKLGVDFAYFVKFDDEFMKKTPEEFILFLKRRLKITGICVGYDYRFGAKASGNVSTLKQLGEKYGFEVFITDAVIIYGNVVGSTIIRRFVNDGDMENARKYLGRYFSIDGKVINGKQNGRRIGFPTANIRVDSKMALPKVGVYAGISHIDGDMYRSVVNVGDNPTFNGGNITVEAHLIGFDENIYGKNIKVEFVKWLRGEIKFNSPAELKEQILVDVKNTEKMKI